MYKPANIREFVTTAIHKRSVEEVIDGRLTRRLITIGTLRGKFKQKGSSEKLTNGLTEVVTNTTYTTWYKSDIQASDVLNINGIDYEIIGDPENVEMRGRYLIVMLEKVSGGA